MKKFLISILSLIVIVCSSLCFSACGNDNDVAEPTIEAAYMLAVKLGYEGTPDEFITKIKGKPGKDGKDGIDGVGIDKMYITPDGYLVAALTNGLEIYCGKVTGENGKDGEDGRDGADGKDGKDGEDAKPCVHVFLDWTEGLKQTCSSMGYDVRKCKYCDFVEYRFTEAAGHSFDSGKVIKAATCTEEGILLKTCGVCRLSKIETLSITEHGFVDGVCTQCGERVEIFNYYLNGKGDGYIVGVKLRYANTVENAKIPDEYMGLPVTEIRPGAFVNCENLKSVVIPKSVVSIGSSVFMNCENFEIYYTGTQEEWNAIEINSVNAELTNAKIYFYSESRPEAEGNYWHYGENGEIIKYKTEA